MARTTYVRRDSREVERYRKATMKRDASIYSPWDTLSQQIQRKWRQRLAFAKAEGEWR